MGRSVLLNTENYSSTSSSSKVDGRGGNACNLLDFDNQAATITCVDTIKYSAIPSAPSSSSKLFRGDHSSPVWGTNYLDLELIRPQNSTAVLKELRHGFTILLGQGCSCSCFTIKSIDMNYLVPGTTYVEKSGKCVPGASVSINLFHPCDKLCRVRDVSQFLLLRLFW